MKNIIFGFVFTLFSVTSVCSYANTIVQSSFTEQPEVNGEGFRYIIHTKEAVIRHPEKVSVNLGPGLFYTENHSWGMAYRNSSYIEVSFEAPVEHFGKSVRLDLIHLAALVKGVTRNAPVSIIINDAPLENYYDPLSAGWVYDQWDITDYVVEGTNTVRIQLLNGPSQYWLNSMFVTFMNDDIEIGRSTRK